MAATEQRHIDIGTNLAKQVFDKRSRGRAQRTTEAHLSEAELAALLALAAEWGAKAARKEAAAARSPVHVGPPQLRVIKGGRGC